MSSSSYSSAFINHGHTVDVTAPYAVVGGQGVLVGSLFGVAAKDALINTSVPVELRGRYNLAKNPVATAISAGALVYWDNTNRRLDTVSSGNKLVGVCVAAADATDTTVDVVLTGQVS